MKTALEWYIENVKLSEIEYIDCKITATELNIKIDNLLKQAKEMEEEQIAAAFDCGYSNGEGVYQDNPIFHGCNYYDETFKSE